MDDAENEEPRKGVTQLKARPTRSQGQTPSLAEWVQQNKRGTTLNKRILRTGKRDHYKNGST